MKVCRGVVKNNAIILEEGDCLPEGAAVEVRVVEKPANRDELFARVIANQIHRYVGIDEIIAEEKKEMEERADRWLQ